MAYLVQVRREPAELQQPVLLKLARQFDVLEVVEAVDRVAEGLVVLLLNKEIIVGIIDRFDVELRNVQSAVCSWSCTTDSTYVLDSNQI